MFTGTAIGNEMLEGITFGDTEEEISASACAISDYLKQLPIIVENLADQPEKISQLTNPFLGQFDDCVKSSNISQIEQCHRDVTTLDDFTMKAVGFSIINSTKTWVQRFPGNNRTCLTNA